MRLRRFTGAHPREALAQVKATLGPEAVILATRPLEGGGVEITAAVDLDVLTATPASISDPFAAMTRELATLTARVTRLDRTIGARVHPGAVPVPDGRDDEQVQAMAERVALLAAPLGRVTAFVGPTGSGKTTTVAKLTAHTLAGGGSVGLVMADTQRIGAAEQLGTYARLLQVPMRVVRDRDELVAALAAFADRDAIYVDTAGLTGDPASAAEVARLCGLGAGPPMATVVVVPASASDVAFGRMWRQLDGLGPVASVVTKVDEVGLGVACEWLREVGVPLGWLGTGTRVPDDLVAADAQAVAAWLRAA
jgi:flagellar biosynthesis GTPase FlhF